MKVHEKILRMQVIFIISAIMGCLFIILGYFIVNDLPGAVTGNWASINAGKSMFFPSLSVIKLFRFNIFGMKQLNITVGHLIDAFIIIEIIMCSESIIFHVWKRTFQWEAYRVPETENLYLFNLNDLGKNGKENTTNCFLYQDRYQSRSKDTVFKKLERFKLKPTEEGRRKSRIGSKLKTSNPESFNLKKPSRNPILFLRLVLSRLKSTIFYKQRNNPVQKSFLIISASIFFFEKISHELFTNSHFTLENYNQHTNYKR